jgi:hypothetical protein
VDLASQRQRPPVASEGPVGHAGPDRDGASYLEHRTEVSQRSGVT